MIRRARESVRAVDGPLSSSRTTAAGCRLNDRSRPSAYDGVAVAVLLPTFTTPDRGAAVRLWRSIRLLHPPVLCVPSSIEKALLESAPMHTSALLHAGRFQERRPCGRRARGWRPSSMRNFIERWRGQPGGFCSGCSPAASGRRRPRARSSHLRIGGCRCNVASGEALRRLAM